MRKFLRKGDVCIAYEGIIDLCLSDNGMSLEINLVKSCIGFYSWKRDEYLKSYYRDTECELLKYGDKVDE